ncbi:MAG: CapA family protein [Ruminococcus sp.]|nr:CapA family protein [Ruminococcus sp.]
MKFRKRRAAGAAAVLAALVISCTGCATRAVGSADNDIKIESLNAINETISTEPEEIVPTEPVSDDKRVHIIAAGDNLIHYSVLNYAKELAEEDENYNFSPIYENVKYLIEDADIAIVNQETIISESNEIRGAEGGALLFNSPPEVADAVIDLGFDVFTMANNHLLDFGEDALTESIQFWNQKAEENNLTVLGAYLSDEDAEDIRIREVNGVKVAFLAYAEHINGFSFSYDSPLRVIMNHEEDVIEEQIKKASEIADAVIVSAHWGNEDTTLVSDDRKQLAEEMIDWGADVILGCHPHTAQTMEWIERDDGSKGFVFYSMGNFVCYQTDNFNLVGEMPDFDIVVDSVTGETRLENVGVIPNIIHYEHGDDKNLRVYPYSMYTPELAEKHGVPYAEPRGTYTDFSWEILNNIIDEAVPEGFCKTDK